MTSLTNSTISNIIHSLLEMIIDNKFPNNLLPAESDLCEIFNVSRSTIRSVLDILTVRGVIKKAPKKKSLILDKKYWDLFDPIILSVLKNTLDPKELFSQIFYLRLTFEPKACSLCAINSQINDLSLMDQALREMKEAANNADVEVYKKADINFHKALFEGTQNSFFIKLSNSIIAISKTSIEETVHTEKEQLLASINNHTLLLNAIRERNSTLAESVMVNILVEAMKQLFDNFTPNYMPLFANTDIKNSLD